MGGSLREQFSYTHRIRKVTGTGRRACCGYGWCTSWRGSSGAARRACPPPSSSPPPAPRGATAGASVPRRCRAGRGRPPGAPRRWRSAWGLRMAGGCRPGSGGRLQLSPAGELRSAAGWLESVPILSLPIEFPVPNLRRQVLTSELPAAALVATGLADLERGAESVAALLVSIGAPRLSSLALALPHSLPDPERRLYQLLRRDESDSAHSRYKAYVRRRASS